MMLLTRYPAFSGSIFNDPDDAHTTISAMLKLNRLPKDTSLRAMRTIQGAWDLVESYHYSADRYKLITKLIYATLLCFLLIVSSVSFFTGEFVNFRVARCTLIFMCNCFFKKK
jgi:hypothetical protein